MATFHLTTQDGAEYEVEAPDEHAAVAALGQVHAPDALKTPEPSTAGDMGALAAKGASFGLADRIGAGGDMLMSKLGLLPPERGDYAANLEGYRKTISDAEARHPIAAPVVETAAGLAAPVGVLGTAAKGAGLGVKALLGGLTGAGFGAVQGAADAPDLTEAGDTAKRGLIGAGVGAIAGAALPVVAKGIGKAYEGILGAVGGKPQGIPRAAAGHLVDALEADTPALVQSEAARLGPQAMMADLGPALQGKAQGAALNSDDARSVMFNALKGRNQGTNARLSSDVNGALGPAQSPQEATDTIMAARKGVHSGLPGVFGAAPPVDVSNVISDIGLKMNKAVGPEKAILGQAKSFLMEPKQVQVNGVPTVRPVPIKDAEKLHNAKMALDMLIDHGDPTLGVPPGAVSKAQGSVADIRKGLNGELRGQVPGYAGIMDQSSGLARQAEAVETGTSILDGGKTALRPDDLAGKLATMVPPEKDALKIGARAEIDRQLGTKANDLVALKGALQGEGGWNTDKVGQIFGPDKASALVDAVDREGRFRDTYNKVVENSQTAQRTAAKDAMKPAPSASPPLFNPSSSFLGVASTLAKKGVAEPLWNALIGRDPSAGYGDVARVLTAQGPERDAHLLALINATSMRSKVSGQGAKVGNSGALAVGLAGLGGANERRLRSRWQ